MSTDIYVDHLPVDVTAEEIREIFCAYGIVEHVSLIKNRDTGCLYGFGFVAMQSGANEAIAALHDRELGGRRLNVQIPRANTATAAASVTTRMKPYASCQAIEPA
jgi:RNA recognition motif-containing protein